MEAVLCALVDVFRGKNIHESRAVESILSFMLASVDAQHLNTHPPKANDHALSSLRQDVKIFYKSRALHSF